MLMQEYIKPVIRKQEIGQMNKFGRAYGRNHREAIEKIPIKELTDRFGSPLFVFSERKIRNQYRRLYREFASRYPRVQFSWSYKTNYLDAVCALFHQEGQLAEVVSEFEYEKARRIGVPGNRIIFNGPYKPDDALKRAFEEHAIVNIDSFEELLRAERVVEKLGRPADVGIRLNMDTGIQPQWSRFGFNLENGAAYDAAKRIHRSQWLNLSGLHCHMGTFILDPRAYARQVKQMVAFMKLLQNEFQATIGFLDLGGGFPSPNKLKGTYHPPEVTVPPLEEYIEAISEALVVNLARHLTPGAYPMVYLETGRAMLDAAGYLITSVVGSNRLPDGRKSYIVDAGVNLLYTSTWYDYRVQVDREVPGAYENATVYGPLCMNIDVVLENTPLPPLSRGDRLILSPMGAYNVTQWMQFIRYRPAVVMIMGNGDPEVIRRAERLSDITALESIPESLKMDGLKLVKSTTTKRSSSKKHRENQTTPCTPAEQILPEMASTAKPEKQRFIGANQYFRISN